MYLQISEKISHTCIVFEATAHLTLVGIACIRPTQK